MTVRASSGQARLLPHFGTRDWRSSLSTMWSLFEHAIMSIESVTPSTDQGFAMNRVAGSSLSAKTQRIPDPPSVGYSRESVAVERTPFQIAVQVRDIAEARRFYLGVLGGGGGRSDEQRLDFNLYGYQVVCHLDPQLGRQGRTTSHYDPVVGKFVPVSHCGIVLETKEWSALAERLMQHKVAFEPSVCFKSDPGEQATLYLLDPSGNALEFKSSRIVAEQLLRRERKKTLGKYAPWAILAAFIWCWILLHGRESANEIPAQLPPCLTKGFCMP
jgi:extradiol dioxygenase family protein